MYSSSSLTRLSAAVCPKNNNKDVNKQPERFLNLLFVNFNSVKFFKVPAETDSDVLVGGLNAVQVVLGEELGQLRLDPAQGLVLTVQQHHQVRHGERLAHQHQQLSEEPWEAQT